MRAYFLRRLLLIPVTLLGLTLILFGLTRILPGGPAEQLIAEMSQLGDTGRGTNTQAISQEQMEAIAKMYGFDKPFLVAYAEWLGNVVRGDFGDSTRYQIPVWTLIADRFPISIYFGVITLIITYSVCVPLGVLKALKHRTFIDTATSVLIFTGYAIPGFVLGAILLLVFSVRLEWLPLSGFTSVYFDELTAWGKLIDLVRHTILPLCCYLIGAFAVVTLLMKNHLLDNLAADYVRTAVAKGVNFRRAVVGHAFRNSIIPIATTFGQNILLLVTGSFLIESLFDINGFGLLGLTAITERDYPIVMAIVTISAFLLLLGNIISDVLVAIIDPRIKFE